MKINTAINFSDDYIEGFVADNVLQLKRIVNVSDANIAPMDKEGLRELIDQLQQVYSVMNNVEKKVNQVTKRNPKPLESFGQSAARPISEDPAF